MKTRGSSTSFRALFLAAVFLLAAFLMPFPANAASYADFRSALEYKDGKHPAKHCGAAAVSGELARLDVRLGKAGYFTLLVDMQGGRMRVLSQKLKAYVETSVDGDAHSWRDLVRSASSVMLPQTLGMVSFQEKSCEEQGRELWSGVEAVKSRCVFKLGFMGSYRDIMFDVWESRDIVPFPLKIEVIEDSRTRGGSVWLKGIETVKSPEKDFLVPEDFTRFTSVLDLILYALSAF